MTEPLGRSQVLEYLIDLSENNKFYLISFERENDLKNLDEIKELVKKHNIVWHYFIYSNRYGVFSTIYQLLKVIKLGIKIKNKKNIKVIHARSFIPAVMGYAIKFFDSKVKLLFDVRGFSTKEKIDRGRLVKNSILYKILLWLENCMFKKADALNTLTYKAKEILEKEFNFKKDYIEVIPTCANKEIFKILTEDEKLNFRKFLGYTSKDIIVIHTGTVSGWYDFDRELILINELMKQNDNIKFLILNKNEVDFIEEKLNEFKINREKVKITSSVFSEVYKYLNIADVSLFFIKPTASKQASAPTKFAENIACLLPSVTNSGVGDMEFYLNKYDVGWIYDLNNIENNKKNITKEILLSLKDKKVHKEEFENLFNEYFSKNIAITKYNNIYKRLINE
jgi:hypothetical protein